MSSCDRREVSFHESITVTDCTGTETIALLLFGQGEYLIARGPYALAGCSFRRRHVAFRGCAEPRIWAGVWSEPAAPASRAVAHSDRKYRDPRWLYVLPNGDTQLGGRRRWLSCLDCGGRCRVIYGGRGKRFRCRKCHGLVYRSTRQAWHERSDTNADKLAFKICGARTIPT